MQRYLILSLFCLLAIGGWYSLNAQEEIPANPPPAGATTPAPTANTPPTTVPATQPNIPANVPVFNENAVPTRSNLEIWLSVSILAFGAVITLAMLFLLAKRTEAGNANDFIEALRYPIVLVIVVATLFLVTAGYGNTQMAPILGLLGTIAGYLMGRSKQSS